MSTCAHRIEGACTHPRSHSTTCVMDDSRAHQCRLVYNDRRRASVVVEVDRREKLGEKLGVKRVAVSPFDALFTEGK